MKKPTPPYLRQSRTIKNRQPGMTGGKDVYMANISYIQVCKVCDHYNPSSKGLCATLGKRQVINVANNCPHFSGEKYKFDHDKAKTIGERPSTFSRND